MMINDDGDGDGDKYDKLNDSGFDACYLANLVWYHRTL